ncbi:MAG: cytochrome c oxidase assembly protein [Candidatus Eremiobacteraeota bacterium]|nr:cytochrome c oxidase assembly protein [Candidatus Eremiobacteraeota bacterium]
MKVRVARRFSLLFAIVLGALALSGPVERLADTSFAWHMTQHIAIIFLVPLGLLLARPFELFAAAGGKDLTARVVRASRGLHFLGSPPLCFLTFVAILWGTHFTPLYTLALANRWLHAAEHLLYFAAGIMFWLPVVAPPPLRPLSYPARLLYLLVALPQGAFIGFVIASARTPLYPHYAASMPFGAALADQQAAAAIMWVAGGALLLSAFLATLGVWAWHENRPARLSRGT